MYATRYEYVISLRTFFKTTQQYVQCVYVVKWKDEKFRICKDSIPISIMLLVVYFDRNYTLQPQNDIYRQYYNLDQVSIMVHITYRHGMNSSKKGRILLN